MRYVKFDPRNLDVEEIDDTEKAEFRSWLEKADAAARKAVKEYEKNETPLKEDEGIWRAHKKWLLRNKFYNKCAYCEKSLEDIPQDAEHWRPKRKITGVDHPGYFWLAYSWRNLLPACSMCNSYAGKKNQFPISNSYVFLRKLTDAELEQLRYPSEAIPSSTEAGSWYLGAEDLDALESPLLLHPYSDEDPTVHLEFRDNGYVRSRTKKGECSIRVFDLNREALREAREMSSWKLNTWVRVERLALQELGWSAREALDHVEAQSRTRIPEKAPYSAAARAALARAIATDRALLERGSAGE